MMMVIMPVMMLVMFYSFPSALSLYWTLSQVLSIVQMWYIRKKYTPAPIAASGDTVEATVVTRQMRRHAGSRNQHAEAFLCGGCGKLFGFFRRSVCRIDVRFKRDAERAQGVCRFSDDGQVAVAAHYYTGFLHFIPPEKIKKGTLRECISGVPRRSAEKEFFCSLAVLCNNPSVAENSSVLYLKYTKYKTFQSRRIGELFYFRSLSQ